MKLWTWDNLLESVQTNLSGHEGDYLPYQPYWPNSGLDAKGIIFWARMKPLHRWQVVFHLPDTFDHEEQINLTHWMAKLLAEPQYDHLLQTFGMDRNESAVAWLEMFIEEKQLKRGYGIEDRRAKNDLFTRLHGLQLYYSDKFSDHARLLKVADAYQQLSAHPRPKQAHALFDVAEVLAHNLS